MFETISVKELDEFVEKSYCEIVDLRTKEKYLKGHIKGAINCTFDRIEGLDCIINKEKMIIFYCDRGGNSLLAAKRFDEMGYQAVSLVGGIGLYRGNNWIGRK
ncbi:MAG: rhodanese-like domain-containing protein [Lachnospira sp.]|nr:rhodanese-like domain-containing protein [Lachnospira sp.]